MYSSLLGLLKMDGFPIGSEESFIDIYENELGIIRNSDIIDGVSLKKDGAYMAKTFAPSIDEYKLISGAANRCIQAIQSNMGVGVYDVSPYRKAGKSPCAYCAYKGACGYDIMKREDVFRVLAKLNDKAQLALLKAAAGEGAPGGAAAHGARGRP